MQEKNKPSVGSGAIAGICVTVIVVIGLIIGVVIYRRYWRYPTARPFWTVELKDDHEGICFSSVPEDELVAITAREEEEERKRGKSGSQPYTKLRENIWFLHIPQVIAWILIIWYTLIILLSATAKQKGFFICKEKKIVTFSSSIELVVSIFNYYNGMLCIIAMILFAWSLWVFLKDLSFLFLLVVFVD